MMLPRISPNPVSKKVTKTVPTTVVTVTTRMPTTGLTLVPRPVPILELTGYLHFRFLQQGHKNQWMYVLMAPSNNYDLFD